MGKRKQKTTTQKATKKLTQNITRSKCCKIGGMVNFNATTFLMEMTWIRKTTDFICRQASTDRKTEGETTQNDKHKKEKLIIDRHSIYIQRLQAIAMKKDKKKKHKMEKKKTKNNNTKSKKETNTKNHQIQILKNRGHG